MPSTTSPNKGYELQATNENDGTWGTKANAVFSTIDLNLGGRNNKSVAGSVDVNLSSTEAKAIYQNYTGLLTASINVVFPTGYTGHYIIKNATTGAFTLSVKPSGGTALAIPQGTTVSVFIDPDQTAAVLTSQPALDSGGSLAFASGLLRRAALTGDVTAAADSNATVLGITTTRGDVIVRGAAVNGRLAIGAANRFFVSDGTDPLWQTLTAMLDTIFGNTRGMVLTRGAANWQALALGASGKVLRSDGIDAVWDYPHESIIVAASDETTNLTTGTAKVKWRMPYAFTLTAVRASLSTAQASGSIFTVDINEEGASILSTKLTIDNTEKTSTTAATPPVISDSALADDAEMSVDIDQVGTAGAKGLKIMLIGKRA